MASNLDAIKKILSSDTISADDKKTILTEVKALDRELTISEFKRTRIAKEKNSIAILLEETIEELQNKTAVMIQAGKMAVLGQLVAGVAHEVNTPLGAIGSSINNIMDAQKESIELLPQLFAVIDKEEIVLFKKLIEEAAQSVFNLSSREERKLRRSLTKELEEEGIEGADEIADLLTDIGIYKANSDCLKLIKSVHSKLILRTVYSFCILQKNGSNIKLAVNKASKIVYALKTYGRQKENEEKTIGSITESVETVLTLYSNQLKQGIEVQRDFDEIPEIEAYYDELSQVWTNIIHNAMQAMSNKGLLKISIKQQAKKVVLSIKDSGTGMPKHVMSEIFKPFYTTKPSGEGSGLGLDIVQKIITKHKGTINVESEENKGTTFTITLPIT